MARLIYRLCLCLTVIFVNFGLFAQFHPDITSDEQLFRRARELFEREKYPAASRLFEQYLATHQADGLNGPEAMYFRALCALQLQNNDAEYQVITYLNRHPESGLANDLRFRLGQYYFERKAYRQAAQWYSQVHRLDLPKDQYAECCFRLGYAWFAQQDYEKARTPFFEIKDIDSKYRNPANYYYAHINYELKNYQTALEGFLKLTDDESFKDIVPYYIVQIYHLQEKYDDVIRFGPSMLEKVLPARKAEVARMIGEAWFRKENFTETIRYMELYAAETKTTTREDKYVLGYSFYKTQNFSKAAENFEDISASGGVLSQFAYYYLADCYMQLGDKNKAKAAFYEAYRLASDDLVTEDALFQYAKITYELAYNPFNEAIRALNDYLDKYPSSKKRNEVYKLLTTAYLNSRNYKLALESIEKVKNPDDGLLSAMQRIAFFRALELINNLQYSEAVMLLDKVKESIRFDAILAARAWYWQGEAWYRMGDLAKAGEGYHRFLAASGSRMAPEHTLVHYNLGYVGYNQKQYANALRWFQDYVQLNRSDIRSPLTGDALNRLGDIYFVQMEYENAIAHYDKAIAAQTEAADYAIFQKAFCLGILGRHNEKTPLLRAMIQKYPESAYTDDAWYELGRSAVAQSEYSAAATNYRTVIEKFPHSSYVPKSLIQLGLLSYNTGKNKEALNWYSQVISKYPGTEDARSALAGMKNIYVEENNVNEYFDLVKSLGGVEAVTVTEQDSLTFKAAENVYMAGQCSKATQLLSAYLSDFPEGQFRANALFYNADCAVREGRKPGAKEPLIRLAAMPRNVFTEPGLRMLAGIYYEEKSYTPAREVYARLEAMADQSASVIEAQTGLMRCYYEDREYTNAIVAADKLLINTGLSAEVVREANYKMAKCYLALNENDKAMVYFKKLATDTRTIEGAEAAFRIAELYFAQGRDKLAEEQINELIDKNTPHQYWMAKSFLLLSDIFVSRGDDFQAGHTLQSIIDYYEDSSDGILDEAKSKKRVIDQRNEAGNRAPVPADVNIDVNNQ